MFLKICCNKSANAHINVTLRRAFA